MEKTRIKLLMIFIVAVCAIANSLYADEPQPQRSTSGPKPPLAVIARDANNVYIANKVQMMMMAPVIIPNVPDYNWTHGCGPTALGNVIGYYDGQGYGDLIPGNASTQTNDVNQAMASGGDANGPYPPLSERHYEDYARPEDDFGPLQTDDYITQGRIAHANDCIADYMKTSQSNYTNQYGWSWSNHMGWSFTQYVNQKNASYNPSYTEYSPVTGNTLTWAVMKNEIDNGRPMVFLVDLTGDGLTEHFVTVVGYDASTNQYGFLDTWNVVPTGIRWETFQDISTYQPWSIWGGWAFNLGNTTKWEQPPDTTYYGVDVRCDRQDNIQRVLADDFNCTKTGPITKVRLWGSWKGDIKGKIQKIHLSIHSDDPVGIGGTDPTNIYSKPDTLLWSKDFNSPHFTESLFMANTYYEYWWDPITGILLPNGDRNIWQYDITIDSNQFIQEGTPTQPIVYWLDAYVVLEPNSPTEAEFGWKTSIEHWNDDAVWSLDNGIFWNEMIYPPTHPRQGDSADLAFAIITGETTEPNEPNIPNAKYIQRPDLTTNGVDVRLDDSDGVTRHIADDFPCNTPGPITDVHFWGSWKNDLKCPITAIIVSFYDDNPLPPFSKPNNLLWQHKFMAGEFTETLYKDLTPEYEWWWDPFFNYLNQNGDHQVWKYDINIDPRMAFRQEGNTINPKVYWLELQVWLPYGEGYNFGWKTSRQHWNDDAVFATGSIPPYTWNELRYPQGHPYCPNSMDMAFAITTGGEPNIPADPNIKFIQHPDETANGTDIRCDRKDGVPRWLADDFVCFKKERITDIHLWGSWLGEPTQKGEVNSIHLSIHSDIPEWQNPYGDWSTPGPVLWQKDFPAGSFRETLYRDLTFYEKWWDRYTDIYLPNGDRQIWQYDITIDPCVAFMQQGEPNKPVVYWLDVYVQLKSTPPTAQFGWKTSIEHFSDSAVYFDPTVGYWQPLVLPSAHPLHFQQDVDMAFSITGDKSCFPRTNPRYSDWVFVDKPRCWCACVQPRQCHGDADGKSEGKSSYWTSVNDLAILKAAWNKSYTQIKGKTAGVNPPGTALQICADFDHKSEGKASYRVSINDLSIVKAYWNKAGKPDPNCAAAGN